MDDRGAGYFCSNPLCPHGLHVRAGDPGVKGDGNWAELPDGALIGRGIYQSVYLCDPCGQALLAGAVTLELAPPLQRAAVPLGEQINLGLA